MVNIVDLFLRPFGVGLFCMFFTLKISPFSFVLFCFVLLLLLLCGILGRSVVEEEDEDVELPCFLALFFSGDDDEMFPSTASVINFMATSRNDFGLALL